jgi:type I restriction enzyme S subunit
MTGGLKPYPEYRDSGTPWLGCTPAHWEIRNLRTLVKPRRERNRQDLPLLSVVREKGVIRRSITGDDDNHNFIPDDLSNYKVCKTGDLVINKMKAWQGSLGIAPCDGIVSPAYFVFALGLANHTFGQVLLRSKSYVGAFARASDGVRVGQWDLSIRGMREIPVLLPLPDEQAAIVRFLNRANRQLEGTIRAKKKLIALLNEEKQSIIHDAVTRGLDPNVRLKPSGIPWLGNVPKHWSISRLKFETSHIVDCLHATPKYAADGQYPAIRTADIEPGKVRLKGARRVSGKQYALWTSRLAPREGDILYSREGERYGIAALVPAGIQLCVSQRMMVFRIRPPQQSPFMMWQLNCPHVYSQASADTIGATSPHVNVEQIKNFQLVLPPPKEQEEISTWISTHTASLDSAIVRAQREIELVREYRTRLTADVVTGQLDVREAACNLPAEVEAPDTAIEPEAEDEAEELLEAVDE